MKKLILFIVLIASCFQIKAQEGEQKSGRDSYEKKEATLPNADSLDYNSRRSFSLKSGVFVGQQGYDGYVVYEFPGMSAPELKSAAYTTLASMFNSPKDAITNISDNIIQLEGYSPSLYQAELSFTHKKVDNHIIFNIVLQFKDGKVRYNTPSLKYIHMKVEDSDTQKMSNISGVNLRDYFDESDAENKIISIENYINNLIFVINSKLKKSNDW